MGNQSRVEKKRPLICQAGSAVKASIDSMPSGKELTNSIG